jgi:hypothetical protein
MIELPNEVLALDMAKLSQAEKKYQEWLVNGVKTMRSILPPLASAL